jgi:ABC-type glycerol-3-phosphate transport system permease component
MLFPLLFLASFSLKDAASVYEMPPKLIPKAAKSITIITDYSKYNSEDSDMIKDYLLRDSTLSLYTIVTELNKEAIGEIKFIGTMNGKTIFYQRAHAMELKMELDYKVYKSLTLIDRTRLFAKDKFIKSAEAIGYLYDLSGMKDKYSYDNEALGKNELNDIIIGLLTNEEKDRGLNGDIVGTTMKKNGFLWLENYKYYATAPNYMYHDVKSIAKYGLFSFLFNTILVMVWAFITQVGLCSLSAYSISRLFGKKMSKILLLYFLGTTMIPFMCILVPQAQLMNRMGLLDTYGAMLLPYLYPSAAYIFLFKGFFDKLPQDLLDAAKIDGASEVYVYSRIVMPLSKSIIAVIGLNVIVSAWNDFFWYNYAANSTRLWTINLAIYNIAGSSSTDYNVVMGISFLTILPILVLCLVFSKQIKESLLGSAIKG